MTPTPKHEVLRKVLGCEGGKKDESGKKQMTSCFRSLGLAALKRPCPFCSDIFRVSVRLFLECLFYCRSRSHFSSVVFEYHFKYLFEYFLSVDFSIFFCVGYTFDYVSSIGLSLF